MRNSPGDQGEECFSNLSCNPAFPLSRTCDPLRTARMGREDHERGAYRYRQATGEGAAWIPRPLGQRSGPRHATERVVSFFLRVHRLSLRGLTSKGPSCTTDGSDSQPLSEPLS